MTIIVNLDFMMAKRKMSLNELSEIVNISLANLSKLKTEKAKRRILELKIEMMELTILVMKIIK